MDTLAMLSMGVLLLCFVAVRCYISAVSNIEKKAREIVNTLDKKATHRKNTKRR